MNNKEDGAIRLLHVSDLHFGPPYLKDVGEAALRIAADLNPESVIISGDLTQRAKREQFVAAKQFLVKLSDNSNPVDFDVHDPPLIREEKARRWNAALKVRANFQRKR